MSKITKLKEGSEVTSTRLFCPHCENNEEVGVCNQYGTFVSLHCSPTGVVHTWKCMKCGWIFYTEPQ